MRVTAGLARPSVIDQNSLPLEPPLMGVRDP
jgi:hypothetical protein